MKKKLLSIVFILTMLGGSTYLTFLQNKDDIKLSDLALDNIEALGGCEIFQWINGYTVTIYDYCWWDCRSGGVNNCPL